MKTGYKTNIEQLTLENTDYRRVLYTSNHSQLVVMCIAPNADIGLEVHEENDQFFRFEQGTGKVIINDTEYLVSDGDAIVIPAGAKHNIVNTSTTEDLKLYTIYSPPHHKDGIIRHTKQESIQDAPEFDGELSE